MELCRTRGVVVGEVEMTTAAGEAGMVSNREMCQTVL
jgi:hypothetical protein